MEDRESRRARKEDAKRLKRKRIEEGNGKRPRSNSCNQISQMEKDRPTVQKQQGSHQKSKGKKGRQDHGHRFGRVMEQVPCLNKSRSSTLSIAIPGSVVSNAQTKELRTHLVGQIARAAAIYHVDEIIVYDDKLSKDLNDNRRGFYQNKRRDRHHAADKDSRRHEDADGEDKKNENADGQNRADSKNSNHLSASSDPHEFMARVLQYCECPQYLRRYFFSMHPDLQFGGLLPPLDAPHHVRVWEKCKYREGIVLDKTGRQNGGSLVNCGIRDRPVEIDRVLTPGLRCTVMLDTKVYDSPGKQITAKVVSPTAPREDTGTYWGYTTRLATSINAIFDESPYGAYDLKIGTSERGDKTVDDSNFQIPSFKHSLIVFGGVAGIEECIDADESMTISGENSKSLFDIWLNICPYQASRTIRTEEAVMITLARMSPHMLLNTTTSNTSTNNTIDDTKKGNQDEAEQNTPVEIQFSDSEPSDESSSDEN